MMNKKGEMGISTVISMIVLVSSLVVILIFFAIYPWVGTIDKEACHQSIIQRSTFNAGPFEPGKSIPLRCATEKICITKSGEDCKEFPAPSKEIPITKKEVETNENAQIKVMDVIAESLYDCHKMLGEGKISFMPHSLWDEKYCLICSRIVFDEELKKETDITYAQLYRNLQQKKTPDGKSYLEFLHPGWENWENVRKLFEEIKKQNPEKLKGMEFEDWKIDMDKEGGYAIIAQELPKGEFKSWLTAATVAGIGIAGTALVATGIGAPIGVGLIGGSIAFVVTSSDKESAYVAPTLIPYDTQTLKELKCTSFETAPN